MKRVFISFRAEDRAQINGLRLLASNPRFNIEFYDESVRTPYNSANATYIRSQIGEKISRSSITICLMSELTHTSDWVSWELRTSIEKGKTIILMGLPGGPNSLTLPPPVAGRQWWLWDLTKLQNLIDSAP